MTGGGALVLLALIGAPQDTIVVRADRPAVARGQATVSADEARAQGAATTAQLVARVPFVQLRSARGETAVSLRGARREQVLVTLDGMPLNDPSTGIADVSDLPLAGIGSASVILGAEPLAAGASTGILALTTSPRRTAALTVGAYGRRQVDGGWTLSHGAARWHAAVMHRTSTNDFLFRNAAVPSVDAPWERRINNDEATTSALVGRSTNAWQASVLVSHGVRGMVGPMNVRAYDADRANTERLLVSAHGTVAQMEWSATGRELALRYQDPTRPTADSRAVARAGDVSLSGSGVRLPAGVMAWRVGGATDVLDATGNVHQTRTRGFATASWHWTSAQWQVQSGARVDALRGHAPTPSVSVAAERHLRRGLSLAARWSQAVRVPTLYDLYFASPQRLTVTALRPERVRADGELSLRWTPRVGPATAQLELAAVARDTRNAIVWFPGNFGWSPANVGAERLRGVESRVQVVTSRHQWSAWVTAYDASLQAGALRIPTPYVPRVAGQVQWSMHVGAVQTTVREQLLGRRPFSVGPRDAAYELPAVALLDMSIAHPLPMRWRVLPIASQMVWSLDNVTNQRWQSVHGFPSPGRSWAVSLSFQQVPTS